VVCIVKFRLMVQIGRPSLLEGGADYTGSGGEVSEVRIGGQCVAMMSGTIVSRYPEPQMGFPSTFCTKTKRTSKPPIQMFTKTGSGQI
jgi:hypothetical protein